MIHLFEHKGILLHVEYHIDAEKDVVFESVRSVGPDYQPVGQDLQHLFHDLLILTAPPPSNEAERFLSTIAEELQ